MCGISFVLNPSRGGDVARRLLRLHAPIRHRGPDDERLAMVHASGCVDLYTSSSAVPRDVADVVAGLGFRRLKIIDVSDDAAQPMRSNDGQTWIVFNGEIYNFRELRDELTGNGHSEWHTDGDTEVILAAYEQWGEECFAHFEGMWAIVIADLRRRRIVASRDRFGIKPLYWARIGSALVLTSEIRQIVTASDAKPRANASRVALHLRGTRFPMTDETFVDSVQAVPPATWFELPIDAPVADPKFREYWRLADFVADPSMRYEDALERFTAVFERAVVSHRVADVGLGSLLSGGLDSSMVSSILAGQLRREGRELPLFSFGFRGEFEKYSELPYAEAVAARENMPLHETSFDAAWVSANVARVVDAIEEPPLAMPVLAQYRVFELCRQHGVTVVLDGQGADEILGGYSYHQRIVVMDHVRRGRAGAAAAEMRAIANRSSTSVARLAWEWFGSPLVRRRQKQPWIAQDYGRSGGVRLDVSLDPSPLNRRLYYDVRWGNVKIILGYADRNAMAHSIEARVPFFDRALVELAFTLPDHHKVARGDRKRILRDAARRRLPAEVTERGDRMGFGTPDGPLIDGPLHDLIGATLRDTRFASQPFLSRQGYESLLNDFDRRQIRDPRAVWRLFTLALWADSTGVTF